MCGILNKLHFSALCFHACDSWGNPLEFKPEEIELLYEETIPNNKIDWKQCKFELVKAAMQGMIANSRYLETAYNKAEKEKVEVEFIVAFNAVRYANEVISILKDD